MKLFAVSLLLIAFVSACKPIERIITKTEYIERLKVDTLNTTRYDSVYIREHGDTVEIFKMKYTDRYRVKILKDTINHTDTLTVLLPGEPVIKYESQKDFIWWVGLIVLLFGIGYIIFKLVTWSPINSFIKKSFKS